MKHLIVGMDSRVIKIVTSFLGRKAHAEIPKPILLINNKCG
jgi:hypothetical protein